jgi:hypothetical protein
MANLSIAQKQMAPMTTIIKTPIKAESIAIPLCRNGPVHHFTMHSPTMHSPALHSILRAIDAVDNFLAVFLAVRERIPALRLRTDAGLTPRLDASLDGGRAQALEPACR